jgi:hypothetical protein
MKREIAIYIRQVMQVDGEQASCGAERLCNPSAQLPVSFHDRQLPGLKAQRGNSTHCEVHQEAGYYRPIEIEANPSQSTLSCYCEPQPIILLDGIAIIQLAQSPDPHVLAEHSASSKPAR